MFRWGITFALYVLGILIIGLALFPGILLCYQVWVSLADSAIIAKIFALSLALAGTYFIYGVSLVFIAGFLRIILRLNLKEGDYSLISVGTAKWVFYNALILLVSVTFMDFMRLTPFASIFYRMMGAKLGKNVLINSKFCRDIALLEIDDGAVIGGHATVIGHSFERNRLILKKVKIGKKAIIGLNAVILPGCEIGDGALIAAGAVLGKNTKVEPLSIYSGVPAISAKERHTKNINNTG